MSYIVLTTIATVVDFWINNHLDALVDCISVVIASLAFWYYLRTKKHELASILLFWIASGVILLFIVKNEFDIGIIFTLLIPMVAFILLSTKKVIIHVGIYFVLLGFIFAYGYVVFDTHPLLYEVKHMSAYIIAMLFVIAFGIFYHIAIEQSYQELELANRQKTFLLKEIHHRVKNNLNIIASILGLQKLESPSEEVHALIDQNRLRLESIAMAHEILYRCDNLAHIDFKTYIEKLSAHILRTESHGAGICMEIDISPLELSIEKMIQFGLMVNEMMTNSIKYAFPNNEGTIRISLKKENDVYRFIYADNGKGLEEPLAQHGFGQSLIEMSVEQLDGVLLIENRNGLQYTIVLKGLDDEDINR
ncbi:sensor histidine kinase [bacterium]|nr:sensor histidine kinase [bacterium]MBU1957973.1 sensor histidine kinase [bacterium]